MPSPLASLKGPLRHGASISATVLETAAGQLRRLVEHDGEGDSGGGPDRERDVPVSVAQVARNVLVPTPDRAGVAPLPVDLPKAVPATAIDVDPERGEVEAPIGVLEALARGVLELAAHLGGRTVVHAEFAT